MDAHERKVRKVYDAIRAKNWKVSFFGVYLLTEFRVLGSDQNG